jgi:MarR family 2-MHQ and catechol resistance regulon transcriptional repressor
MVAVATTCSGTLYPVADACNDPRITSFGMLIEAHAAVVAAVSRDLEQQSGMPVAWFEVLIRLARTPGQRLRMSELAGQVSLSTSGLTRLADRVEAAGYLRREACPSDRRGAFAVLTPEGDEALQRALPAHLQSLERHVAGPLGPDGMGQLESLLRTLRDSAGCPAATPVGATA